MLKTIDFYKKAAKTANFGGEYIEGIAGQPRYLNPVFAAANEVDSDLCELIFSGLFKYSSDGQIVMDAAENIEISADKKAYTIKIKENILWHDQKKLNAEDVCFTARIISDPAYGSPLKESLQSIECQVDEEYKVRFVLQKPYSRFLHNLAFKILPKHIWENVPPSKFLLSEKNLKPIGSGPFVLKKILKDSEGIIHSANLEKFEKYFAQKPFLQNITFRFYENEDSLIEAYNKKEIFGINKLPENWREKIQNVESLNLFKINTLQYFGIFLNQENNKALKDKNVRAALNLSAGKSKIADEIFSETAEKISNIPLLGEPFLNFEENLNESLIKASALLSESGWIDSDGDGIREKSGEKLEFPLIAADNFQFIKTAKILQSLWRQIGVSAAISIKNPSGMNSIIEKRDYSALIFGQDLGSNPDPYVFWHSSQKNHPGLNIALFSNNEADALMEQIRAMENEREYTDVFKKFQNILANEIPAIFLFRPIRFFAANKKILGIEPKDIQLPAARFYNIEKWHINIKYERRN